MVLRVYITNLSGKLRVTCHCKSRDIMRVLDEEGFCLCCVFFYAVMGRALIK